jgi:hypothetical protein
MIQQGVPYHRCGTWTLQAHFTDVDLSMLKKVALQLDNIGQGLSGPDRESLLRRLAAAAFEEHVEQVATDEGRPDAVVRARTLHALVSALSTGSTFVCCQPNAPIDRRWDGRNIKAPGQGGWPQ